MSACFLQKRKNTNPSCKRHDLEGIARVSILLHSFQEFPLLGMENGKEEEETSVCYQDDQKCVYRNFEASAK
jgi:hypothetical protein